MASNSTFCKSRNEDRISGLPDAILCHILSFFSTREAVKTSILSHRWRNVWASVPNLDFDEYELDYVFRTLPQPVRYESDWFAQFVNRVLLSRCPGNIHRFRLLTTELTDVSLIDSWVSTAIKHNVVELVLSLETLRLPNFEIPRCLFMCNTLVSLKLGLYKNICAVTPPSHCFPCLKLLHVTFCFPDSHTVEKLFSCVPVLEDLIIDGEGSDGLAFNLVIAAPKLKRLQISFIVLKFAMITANRFGDYRNYGCQIFVTADAPNLEELDIYYDFLVSYSLKNARCLRKVKIDFLDVKELVDRKYFLGLADRICQLFADICNAKYLTVSAPILVAVDDGYQHLPTFNDLNHLELQLQTCRCLQSLTTWLKISPNLEHLKISPNRNHLVFADDYYKYCDDDSEDVLVHEWCAPEFANICLVSYLKTVCLWDFKGCPNDMEVAKYLVKHGKALNRVTIHTHFSENNEMKSQSPTTLWSKFSKFPRGSKECEIEFQIII